MTNEEKKRYLKAFGEQVKYYRKKLNITQEELAVKIGYIVGTNPSSAISKIERGEMEITQTKIAELAKALGVSPSDLFPSPNKSPAVDFYAENEKILIEMYRTADSATKKHVRLLLEDGKKSESEEMLDKIKEMLKGGSNVDK